MQSSCWEANIRTMIKKFRAFYETRRFTCVHTTTIRRTNNIRQVWYNKWITKIKANVYYDMITLEPSSHYYPSHVTYLAQKDRANRLNEPNSAQFRVSWNRTVVQLTFRCFTTLHPPLVLCRAEQSVSGQVWMTFVYGRKRPYRILMFSHRL